MNMTQQQYIEEAEKALLHTYNRYQVVLDRGEGVYLYDLDGKKYLDFASGIAVFALGYHYQDYDDALKAQIDKLIHTSNYYYNVPAVEAAKKLKAVSGMDRVFFTNSGAEAIEGAIKAARKYAFLKDGKTDHEIIAMEHSFHGRTMGALSVTGNPKYREAFEPGIGNIRFARMNDFDSVLSCVSDKTCAILLETVQGEGGVFPAQEAFLKSLRALCDERDILLILDEIQCGMGRTGAMFAWQKYGVKPDIMTCAKALGCAAVCKVLDLFEKNHIIEHVNEVSGYLEEKLDALAAKYERVLARRGMGLMQGLVLDGPAAPVIASAMEDGLILINAGPNILRFVPPLVITAGEVDEMAKILDRCLAKEA